jgi:hypothetical protein
MPRLCGTTVDPSFHLMSAAFEFAPPHCDLGLLQQVFLLRISPSLQFKQQALPFNQSEGYKFYFFEETI